MFHRVEVEAESLYEASVLAVSVLSKQEWAEVIGPRTKLEIQIIEPGATHMLYAAQLRQCSICHLESPAETLKKQKLRALLAS